MHAVEPRARENTPNACGPGARDDMPHAFRPRARESMPCAFGPGAEKNMPRVVGPRSGENVARAADAPNGSTAVPGYRNRPSDAECGEWGGASLRFLPCSSTLRTIRMASAMVHGGGLRGGGGIFPYRPCRSSYFSPSRTCPHPCSRGQEPGALEVSWGPLGTS